MVTALHWRRHEVYVLDGWVEDISALVWKILDMLLCSSNGTAVQQLGISKTCMPPSDHVHGLLGVLPLLTLLALFPFGTGVNGRFSFSFSFALLISA